MKKIILIASCSALFLIGYSQDDNKKPEAKLSSKSNDNSSKKENTKEPEAKMFESSPDKKEKTTEEKSDKPEKTLLKGKK